MKVMIVVALALVATAVALPVAEQQEPEKIVSSEFNQYPEGRYDFKFETERGINRKEEGEVKEVIDEENKPHTVVVVRGSYSYVNTEGKPETITYYADENGYHADGESVPKNPPSRR